MSALTDISDAVVTLLNAATLSQDFTAERVYVPVYDTKTTSGLKVYVLGLAMQISKEAGTRSEDEHTYNVKVAIYKRVDNDLATLDELSSFTEEVVDLFRETRRLTGYPAAVLRNISVDPVYDPAQLEKFGVFATVVTLNYRLLK